MTIIEQHIEETKAIIASNDQKKAQEQYDKLFAIYNKQIEGYANGTTVLQSKMNAVWNLNDGFNLPTECDYIEDLKLVLDKIILFKQTNSGSGVVINNNYNLQNQGTMTINDNSINIKNSSIEQSTIGSEKKKVSGWSIFATIIGVLAGVATIVSVVLKLYGVIG